MSWIIVEQILVNMPVPEHLAYELDQLLSHSKKGRFPYPGSTFIIPFPFNFSASCGMAVIKMLLSMEYESQNWNRFGSNRISCSCIHPDNCKVVFSVHCRGGVFAGSDGFAVFETMGCHSQKMSSLRILIDSERMDIAFLRSLPQLSSQARAR